MNKWKELIGKEIKTIRGFLSDKRQTKDIEPRYILFDDKKTFIEMEEQKYYTYHDCSTSAREITISKDKVRWNEIYQDRRTYPVTTE